MKKILTASLVAMMAVTAANADIASTQYVNKKTGDLQFTDAKVVQSGSNLTAAVMALDEKLATVAGTGEGSVESQIESAVGELGNGANGQAYTNVADAIAGEVKELADGAVAANTGAINAINNETTGIKAQANKYTDDQIDLLVGTVTGEGVVTSISQADGKVTATLQKIGDDQVNAISQEKITGLTGALADRQLKADLSTTATVAADKTSDVKYPSVAATQKIVGDAIAGLTGGDITNIKGTIGAVDAAEYESKTGDPTVVASVTALQDELGTVTSENMGTTASNVADAIKEVVGEKADKANTLAGYGIGDAYTKTETDSAITTKIEGLDAKVAATANNVIIGIEEVDGKLTQVTSAQIKDAYIASDAAIAKTKLAADVQTSLGAADSAMQWDALKKDASWTIAGCNAAGVICSLVADGGNISWQKVVNE